MADPWDRRERQFDDHPLLVGGAWLFGIVLMVLLVMALLTPFGWGFAWLQEGARITGPDNSREQFTAIIDDYNALKATAGNACDASKPSPSSSNDPQLLEDPAFAYKAKYRSIKVDYDRRMANAFEAGIIRRYPGLRNYPREAPSLKAAMRSEC